MFDALLPACAMGGGRRVKTTQYPLYKGEGSKEFPPVLRVGGGWMKTNWESRSMERDGRKTDWKSLALPSAIG